MIPREGGSPTPTEMGVKKPVRQEHPKDEQDQKRIEDELTAEGFHNTTIGYSTSSHDTKHQIQLMNDARAQAEKEGRECSIVKDINHLGADLWIKD